MKVLPAVLVLLALVAAYMTAEFFGYRPTAGDRELASLLALITITLIIGYLLIRKESR